MGGCQDASDERCSYGARYLLDVQRRGAQTGISLRPASAPSPHLWDPLWTTKKFLGDENLVRRMTLAHTSHGLYVEDLDQLYPVGVAAWSAQCYVPWPEVGTYLTELF